MRTSRVRSLRALPPPPLSIPTASDPGDKLREDVYRAVNLHIEKVCRQLGAGSSRQAYSIMVGHGPCSVSVLPKLLDSKRLYKGNVSHRVQET